MKQWLNLTLKAFQMATQGKQSKVYDKAFDETADMFKESYEGSELYCA